MKTKILIITIALLVCVSGCKTVKQTETKIKTNTTENNTVKQSNVSAVDVNAAMIGEQKAESKTAVEDKVTVNETTTEETTTTNFSQPDLNGKQYPTSQTKTKKTTQRGENKNLKVDNNTKTDQKSNSEFTDKSDYKSDFTDKIETKVNLISLIKNKLESKAVAGISWGVVILIAGLLVLLYFILKRYRIVK